MMIHPKIFKNCNFSVTVTKLRDYSKHMEACPAYNAA